jgi:hypothetical protein
MLVPMATTHCCDDMARAVEQTCDIHPDRFACPDALVHYSDEYHEYGLIIHDGGSSFSVITFCPWCGARLPRSFRA